MPIFGERQTTSITVKINQLSTPDRNLEIDESIELYLSDLIELIKIQPNSGAVEAARAIRKKIKYGNSTEESLRALGILELLVLNSGHKIGPVIARDDKLLDVLKGIISGSGRTGTGGSYPKEIQRKVRGLAIGWKTELDGLDGYKYMALLWKNIPRERGSGNSSSSRSRSASVNVFGSELDNVVQESPRGSPRPSSPRVSGGKTPPPRPTAASPFAKKEQPLTSKRARTKKSKHKNKKRTGKYADPEFKIPQINYKVEAPKIRNTIAECHTHTTALVNALIALPPSISPLDDAKAAGEFEKCREIRRKVLRYLQFVGAGGDTHKADSVVAMDEEFLGSLIVANEQLVESFKKYDSACGYTEENPAPQYNDETDSDDGYESYYTDSSEEEEQDDEDLPEIGARESSLEERLQRVDIKEGTSSKRAPPPIPPKSNSLKSSPIPNAEYQPSGDLSRLKTNDTAESDPFGDGNIVSKSPYA
ncbi:LAS seventeen-binding protein 5 [[Candida] anglica]|uniref:LAS seventeen-binding protein 5 n=1 Tax=[Candida] anglica TaxID=148631 RepID=A0ABP0EFA8_9ASCO